MGETTLEIVRTAMASPWLYAAIVGLAVLDGLLPLVPSEAAVLLAGTFAATQGPNLGLVILAGAVGALAGDHLAYAVGRAVGDRVAVRARPGGRAWRLHAWAREAGARRGGPVLVGARFVPGGRTAMTLGLGAARFPLRRFAAYDSVACVAWAVQCALMGYLGGRLFEGHPLLGLGFGMALALLVGLVAEVVRRRRGRRVASTLPAAP